MVDSQRIEEEAVDAVKRSVRSADLLTPFITENDKGPCWDGFVAVYKDNKKTNDGIRRVHVQVKGTTSDCRNGEILKYDVDTVDLEAYREDGGCIYFVVYEKYEGNNLVSTSIYYQDLLPFKIYKIQCARKRQDQKTIRVEFKRFPEKPNEITSIFLQFLENHAAQGAFSVHSIPYVTKMDNRRHPIEIPIIAYDNNPPDPVEALLKADAYLYVRNAETGTLFPIDILNREGEIKQIVSYEVTVGERVYYDSVLLIRKRNQTRIKIGKSVTLEYKEGKLAVHVSMCSFLRQFVKDYEFVTAILRNGSFKVNNCAITLERTDSERFENKLREADETYRYYKKIDKLMDALGCCIESDDSVDFDTSKLNEKDFSTLAILYKAIVSKKPVGGFLAADGLFTAFRVADKSIVVQINKARRGKYRLKRIDQTEWKLIDRNREAEIPLFAIYKKEELLHCINIEFSGIMESLQSIEVSAYLYVFSNNLVLQLLMAMDEAHGIRKSQLEEAAIQITDWLNSITDPDLWDNRISKINRYIIEKRKRLLTSGEIEDIRDLIDDSGDSNLLRFGLYVLIDDDSRAEKFFSRLEKREQAFVRKLPIYGLWKKKRGA